MSVTTAQNGKPESPARPSPDDAGAHRSPIAEEYAKAIRKNVVTFEQVVGAAFARRPSNNDSDDRQLHARYFAPLLRSFADAHRCPKTKRPHNGILRYYFASHIDAAVIMTANDELYVQFKPAGANDGDFIDLLVRLTGVHIKARHVLQREDYRTIMESVFTVISYCMSSLDLNRSGPAEPADDVAKRERAQVLRFLQRECARAEQDLDNIIHRRAERTYFNGMLGAVIALGVAAVVLANLLDHSGNFDATYKYLLTVGLAGSIGATISVMWRITFGRFSPSNAIIAFQRGKRASLTLAILGAVRPFIGAVFGLIVFALDRAGLLPLEAPEGADADLYYYAAIAFFAGFSERWAQSTLKNAIPLSEQTALGTDPQLTPARSGQKPSQQ